MGQEAIINFIKSNGPVLPAKVAKAINANLLLASAQLSELADNKKLKISNLKVGGSPLYYLEGQESQLQNFSDNLNEKDRKAYEYLKEKKVLKDSELEPLMRVSMRALKDFAIPLQVTYNDEKHLFWKWYLAGKEETEKAIGEQLGSKETQKIPDTEPLPAEKDKEEREKAEQIREEAKKRAKEEERREAEKREENHKAKKAEQEKTEREREKTERERSFLEQEKKKLEEERKKLSEEKKKLEEERNSGKEDVKEKEEKPKKEEPKDDFLEKIEEFFNENNIVMESHEIVRKGSEIDLLLKVPSVFGDLNYYCKAKNKKRISDSDLSSAFVQGQLKKMPVIMMITGELTKKAEELLNTEFKTNLTVKKI